MQKKVIRTAQRQDDLRLVSIKGEFSPAENIVETWHIVNISDTVEIECLMFTPVQATSVTTFFYIPGTASATFCLRAEQVVCSNFAAQHNWRVILIIHRLSQQNKYPIPLNDISHCINYFIKEHRDFSIDTNALAIGGFSAGGLLSLLICLIASQRKNNPFSQIILIAPVVDLTDKDRPYHNDAKFVDPTFFRHMIDCIAPKFISAELPSLSPSSNLPTAFKNFPPITIIYGDKESFVNDVEQFIQKIESFVSISPIKLPDRRHDFPWRELAYISDIKPIVKPSKQSNLLPAFIHLQLHTYPFPEIVAFGKVPAFSVHRSVMRKSLFRKLQDLLLQENCDITAKCIRLFGCGGNGKTGLGQFYYQHSYPFYNFRLWFTVSDIDSLQYQYKNLGLKLKLFDSATNLAKCVTEVVIWLQKQSNYLIVYDDVDPEQLIELKQKYIPDGQGHTIIISRSEQPVIQNEYFIEVSSMTPKEAISLVEKRLPKMVKAECALIAKELNYTALSLSLACDYLLTKQMPLAEFLSLLKDRVSKLLCSSVDAVIDIVVDAVISESTQVSDILFCCSLLSPYQIPLAILNNIITETDFLKTKSHQILAEYSSILTIDEDVDGIMVCNLHPWVQEIIKKKLISTSQLHLKIVNIILEAFAKLLTNSLTDIYQKHIYILLKHVRTIRDDPQLASSINKRFLALTYCKASYLHNVFGSMKEAVVAGESAESLLDFCDDNQKIQIMRAVINSHWPYENAELALKKALVLVDFTYNIGLYYECAKASHTAASYCNHLGQLKDAYRLYQHASDCYDLEITTNKLAKKFMIKLDRAKTLVMHSYVCISQSQCDDDDTKLSEALNMVKQSSDYWNEVYKENIQDDEVQTALKHVKQHLTNAFGVVYTSQKNYPEAAKYIKDSIAQAAQLYKESGRLTAQSKNILSITFDSLTKAVENSLDALNILYKLSPEDNTGIADSYRYVAEFLVKHKHARIAFEFYKHYYLIMRNFIPEKYFASHYKILLLEKVFKENNWVSLEVIDKNMIYEKKIGNHPTPAQVRAHLTKLLTDLLPQVNIQAKKPVVVSQNAAFNKSSSIFTYNRMLFFSGIVIGSCATIAIQQFFSPKFHRT